MAEYRVGRHWGVTIVREGERPAELDDCAFCCVSRLGCPTHPAVVDHLVAVVTNGEYALAERICALLNANSQSGSNWQQAGSNAADLLQVAAWNRGDPAAIERAKHYPAPPTADMSDLALRHAATKVRAIRPGVEPETALAVIRALLVLGWRPQPAPVADSCTCLPYGSNAEPDPACPVHGAEVARRRASLFKQPHSPTPRCDETCHCQAPGTGR